MFVSCVCFVLCRQRPLRPADMSFRGFLSCVCVCVCVRVIYRPQQRGDLDPSLTVAALKEQNTQVTGYSKLEYFSTVSVVEFCVITLPVYRYKTVRNRTFEREVRNLYWFCNYPSVLQNGQGKHCICNILKLALEYKYQYQDLELTYCSEIEISVDNHPVFVGHLCLWYIKIKNSWRRDAVLTGK